MVGTPCEPWLASCPGRFLGLEGFGDMCSPTLPALPPKPSVADLQGGQVASQLFDDGLEGTGLGLGITHEAQVEEQGIAAVLLVLDAYRAAD